jgi:hypothetical protein
MKKVILSAMLPIAMFAQEASLCQPLEQKVFGCKINGESLQFCQGGDNQVRWLRGKLDSKTNPLEITAGTLQGTKPVTVSEVPDQRMMTTTLYIEQGTTTYALSTCDGMMCGDSANRPWLITFQNGKKVSTMQCDEDTWDGGYGGYKTDPKNGKILQDSLYKTKKSKLNVSLYQ